MIGTLMLLDSGRWAIFAKDRHPDDLTSGDVFAVEIAGALQITRMEFAHAAGGGDDMHVPRQPNDDEREGMDWWNGLAIAERGRRRRS